MGYLSLPLALVYLAGLSLTAQFEALTLGVFLLWVGVPGLLSYLYFRRKWIPECSFTKERCHAHHRSL